jgi:glyoxylase-like metal-dependent hydrolase (beta-lactamase superfamily II)
LLIEDGDRLILIDTGMGNKQSEKFFGYYSLWGDHNIDQSLAKYGFHRNDITDVFMTHLHFDHCGGSVQWNSDRTNYEIAFKNARFWSNEEHWEWATKPNAREKASFLSENILPMQESGHLYFINRNDRMFVEKSELNFSIHFVDGHTDKMMIPQIQFQDKTICFMADLIPTAGHIPLPYVMGYDTRPLLTLPEKEAFLHKAADENYYLFLEHDAHNEIITVARTERGIRLNEVFTCKEILSL